MTLKQAIGFGVPVFHLTDPIINRKVQLLYNGSERVVELDELILRICLFGMPRPQKDVLKQSLENHYGVLLPQGVVLDYDFARMFRSFGVYKIYLK